jgi:hypothetical protein
MSIVDKHPDVLQNIESAVVQVYHQHPELNNYAVMRAYEAAQAHYKAEAREHTPKPVNLTGADLLVFEAVQKMCEWRLGRVALAAEVSFVPIPLEDLLECLSRLRKSVDHWTKAGGRQVYLQFIEQFIP